MRRVVSLLVMGGVALQAPAGEPAIHACSLLTRELLLQTTPNDNRKMFEIVLRIPPEEEAIGTGSSCSYGDVHLQVNPFASPASVEKDIARTWSRVAGVGDIAYFRDNKGMWAELYVRSGRRVLTIQMDVPSGRTPAAIQPNTIALANAVLAKLK